MKRLISIFLVLIFVFSLSACSQMPFNGPIEFHSISLTIPERFIRDSTQSKDDLWVFEHNNYSECILISRKDLDDDDASAWLKAYVRYMNLHGTECTAVTFLGNDAVASTYNLDDTFCQEIVFAYDNAFYSVALRGGNESDFKEITDTISLIGVANKAASK